MMNQLVVVGRLTSDPVLMEDADGKKFGTMTLAVGRNYKNADGIYETDFIEFTLWHGIAENVKDYCKKGDIIGVKGRVENDFKMDGQRVMALIAEKVTFLSSKKEGEN